MNDPVAVKTPDKWPFPQPTTPKPGMPMYLWAPHLESIKELRNKIWEDLAQNNRERARERAQQMRDESEKLIQTLELYDE